MLCRPSGFCTDELLMQRDGDPPRDLVLYGEQIADVLVKPLRPEMNVDFGLDQLGSDANPIARSLHAPFKYISHAQFATDLPGIGRLVPIRKSSIA